MSPPKICIVGDNCVDLYPVQTKKFVGGNGVNTAVAVQRNGIHCGYLGIVGNDEDGKLIIETLQKEKIDCQRLRQSEGKTAWTIVHLEDGERIFFEDCLEVQRNFELEEKDYQYLKEYDKDLIQSLGPMSEVGIFSRPGTLDSEIPQILQCLHEAGFALVIMTMGERGAAAFDGQEVFRQSALAVEVIDTLGVGDAFIGSFLSRFVKNASIPSALKHAAEYSAHSCTIEGAF